jgi:monofunctional biosynthetic peptidoglycan transglycosylase
MPGSMRPDEGAVFAFEAPDSVAWRGMARQAGVWTTLELPRAAFVARFRGRGLPDAPPLRASLVREIGLLIGDRQAGPFALGLRRIAALRS